MWIAFEADPQKITLRTLRRGAAGEASLRYTAPHRSALAPVLKWLSKTSEIRTPTFLGTWSDGLFIVAAAGDIQQELAGRTIGDPTLALALALAADLHGGALALVDHHSLSRRWPDGAWSTLAMSDLDLTSVMVVDDIFDLGTGDAHILRVDASGRIERTTTFVTKQGCSFVAQSEILFDLLSVDRRAYDSLT